MEKTMLSVAVDAEAERDAEAVLSGLGISVSDAVDLYLRQISLTGEIPFPVTPRPPKEINADLMTAEELSDELQKGYDDYKTGKVRDARSAFAEFNERHGGEVAKS